MSAQRRPEGAAGRRLVWLSYFRCAFGESSRDTKKRGSSSSAQGFVAQRRDAFALADQEHRHHVSRTVAQRPRQLQPAQRDLPCLRVEFTSGAIRSGATAIVKAAGAAARRSLVAGRRSRKSPEAHPARRHRGIEVLVDMAHLRVLELTSGLSAAAGRRSAGRGRRTGAGRHRAWAPSPTRRRSRSLRACRCAGPGSGGSAPRRGRIPRRSC